MADEKNATEETTGKKSKKKLLILVGGLMLGEAGLLGGAMMFLGKEPEVSTAGMPDLDEEQLELERIVEVLVLDGRLANAKAGITFLYDTEVYVQVRNKHSARVSAELSSFANEIRSDLGAIWRTSDPEHFREPRLENLTRKVEAMLDTRFGADAETGEPIVEKVVVVMSTGFRVDH